MVVKIAVDAINKGIEYANKLPGVNIGKITFGGLDATAQATADATKAANAVKQKEKELTEAQLSFAASGINTGKAVVTEFSTR